MKLILPVFGLCMLLTGALHGFTAERVALVIGNDACQHAGKLNAAVNDAGAVGWAFERS